MKELNNETQPAKTYTAPELTEHGTVEQITGFDESVRVSGPGKID